MRKYDGSVVTAIKRLFRFTLVMAAAVGVMAASLAFIGPRVADIAGAHRSDQEQITLKPLAERSYIYDSHGNLQGTMTNRYDPQNRSRVDLAEIPESVVGSVLAMEDAGFYEHIGINVRSILRAADANIESGGVAQGGSTITQQVVKNSLVGDDVSFSRKLREAFLAVELEKQMSKDEILEYYLNSVYFGGGAYGVQAASEFYFRKDVSELDWAEGAMLAALIRSPNTNNPFRNPSTARDQRSIAFRRLVATDRLTEAEAEALEDSPLPTEPNRPAPPYDYFVEEVKRQLLTDPKFGLGATEEARHRSVYEGGIKVFTTFDSRLQLLALAARNETMPANKGDATFDVVGENGQVTFGTQAIASVEPATGAVKVMVGGPGFERWQFNLTTARRQPGSTMKTFVAATLFEQDFVPSDTVSGGGSCTFDFPWESETITYRGRGGTISAMTASSSNCGYMKLGQIAGLTEVADVAGKVGIKTSLFDVDGEGNPTAPPYSLPLGPKEVTPLEMASAYATFANDGMYNEPYLVERIEDHSGRVIYQHQPRPVRAVSEQTARLITEVLQGVVQSGTGTRAQVAGGQPAAGKTGTTNDSTDVWFVGYTPQLSTAVWMGVPESSKISLGSNRDLAGATGGRFAAATWGHFYSTAFDGEPIMEFDEPEPTRRGKWMGRAPHEVGGGSSSSRSSTTTRRRSTPRAAEPAPPPAAPSPAPEPPADDGPGNGDDPGNGGDAPPDGGGDGDGGPGTEGD